MLRLSISRRKSGQEDWKMDEKGEIDRGKKTQQLRHTRQWEPQNSYMLDGLWQVTIASRWPCWEPLEGMVPCK